MGKILNKVKYFINYVKRNLPKCNRMLGRFKSVHSRWLGSKMVIRIDKQPVTLKTGRKKSNYEDAGPRLKRKLASELASEEAHSTSLLLHAASVSAKKSKEPEIAFLLKKAKSSEDINDLKKKLNMNEPIPISPDSALAFFIENGFTKQQYLNIRALNKQQGCDIFPSYNQIAESKLKCRPLEIKICETRAEVSFQNLLDHTAHRILEMQQEVFDIWPDATECTLIVSYGFDGSTGHSTYKQRFQLNESVGLDDSLFVTTVIPLKLIDQHHRVIWINRTPQSVRFCRPLKIEFVKESTALILKEKKNLDVEIENLNVLS
ncbi:uncharacterized protein LOC127010860 [Drosophila biarmipes]|uniref:uncharacterized protein LOC127010860 n=1 Tax=Drosophila biarmipes TaxID=125945 RepID=UPI0021CCD9E2|nr:uncharacterized protein LOC127010860 [Drosophila biarmipes]XP_050742177.1 uncharacterized protein LOC127010860 [Drosophila biarmipes]